MVPWSPRHRSASSTMCARCRRAPHRARRSPTSAQRPAPRSGREGRRRGIEDPRRPRAGARARARRGEGGDRPPRRAATARRHGRPHARAAANDTATAEGSVAPSSGTDGPKVALAAPGCMATLGDGDHRARREDRQHPAARELRAAQPRRDRGAAAHARSPRLRGTAPAPERGRRRLDASRGACVERARRRGCARGRRTQRRRRSGGRDGRRESCVGLRRGCGPARRMATQENDESRQRNEDGSDSRAQGPR